VSTAGTSADESEILAAFEVRLRVDGGRDGVDDGDGDGDEAGAGEGDGDGVEGSICPAPPTNAGAPRSTSPSSATR